MLPCILHATYIHSEILCSTHNRVRTLAELHAENWTTRMPSLVGAVAVVTGGSGYVGRRLIDALVSQGCKEVRSVDVQKPPADFVNAHTQVTSFVVDIGSDYGALSRSLEGADIVFHLASYGMSGESWNDGGAVSHLTLSESSPISRGRRLHDVIVDLLPSFFFSFLLLK